MPRCSVCDDGAALLCGACVDAELAASRARLAQARRAEADWRAQAEAAPARPPGVDVDAVAAGLAKTLLAVEWPCAYPATTIAQLATTTTSR